MQRNDKKGVTFRSTPLLSHNNRASALNHEAGKIPKAKRNVWHRSANWLR